MTITLNGDTGITTPTYNGTVTAEYSVPVTAFKNRLINGDMRIDQRNAGASVTATTNGAYTLDRWNTALSASSKFTVQQNAGSVTPPVGFINYLGCTSSAATTLGSADFYLISQNIEGLNVADLGWGTANAQSITISFWARSSLTGTFGGALNNSAQNRSYPFSYTISSANTWEQKSVTIAGDTTGTWLTTNGIGIRLFFSLGTGTGYSGTAGSWSSNLYLSATGATSVVGTNGATFYLTGVQLEKGSTATSFDYRPYGQELALCQRYYEKSFDIDTAPANGPNATSTATSNGEAGGAVSNNLAFGGKVTYAVSKRAVPTLTAYGNSSGYWWYISPGNTSSGVTWSASTQIFAKQGTSGFAFSQNVLGNTLLIVGGHWTASAEL